MFKSYKNYYSHSAVATFSSILSWSSVARCVKKFIPVNVSIFLIVVSDRKRAVSLPSYNITVNSYSYYSISTKIS